MNTKNAPSENAEKDILKANVKRFLTSGFPLVPFAPFVTFSKKYA
jgi:hypothetical protein